MGQDRQPDHVATRLPEFSAFPKATSSWGQTATFASPTSTATASEAIVNILEAVRSPAPSVMLVHLTTSASLSTSMATQIQPSNGIIDAASHLDDIIPGFGGGKHRPMQAVSQALPADSAPTTMMTVTTVQDSIPVLTGRGFDDEYTIVVEDSVPTPRSKSPSEVIMGEGWPTPIAEPLQHKRSEAQFSKSALDSVARRIADDLASKKGETDYPPEAQIQSATNHITHVIRALVGSRYVDGPIAHTDSDPAKPAPFYSAILAKYPLQSVSQSIEKEVYDSRDAAKIEKVEHEIRLLHALQQVVQRRKEAEQADSAAREEKIHELAASVVHVRDLVREIEGPQTDKQPKELDSKAQRKIIEDFTKMLTVDPPKSESEWADTLAKDASHDAEA